MWRTAGRYLRSLSGDKPEHRFRIAFIAPSVFLLTAAGTSMPDANLQLGAGYLEAFGKMGIAPIELLHSEIDQQDCGAGQNLDRGCWPSRSSGGPRRSISSFLARQHISNLTAAVL